jgi:hypothetical protein
LVEYMTTENSPVKPPTLKIKFQAKALALVLSIISLSWFFEATRRLKESVSLENLALLGVALVVTVFLLMLQAFWIYLEEKSKGTLRRNIASFERIEQWLKARDDAAAKNVVDSADKRVDETKTFEAKILDDGVPRS